MQDQKRVCKSCGLEKICNPGELGTNGAFRCRDEHGKLWKGKVCVECQAKRRTEQRNKAKVESKPKTDSET